MTYNILLGITGGIAAYKTPDLVRKLKAAEVDGEKVDVKAIVTENGAKLVSAVSLSTVTKNRVYTDSFDDAHDINHIALKDWADLLLVVPATANFLGKAAHGIADDLLTTTYLAVNCPILIAPAMNTDMWEKKIVQKNIETLKERGAIFIEPEIGKLACDAIGKGKLADLEDIVNAALLALKPIPQVLSGKKVVVTAGPTREYLDPVRYITNPSSGKMGYELAIMAQKMGAKVTLISGQTSLQRPSGVNFISVVSTEEMANATIEQAKSADIIIGAAAPSDLTPQEYSLEKVKKEDIDSQIAFKRTTDILKEVGKNKTANQILVAFAAESDEERIMDYAAIKLKSKNADMVVANNIKRDDIGFNADYNEAVIIFADGTSKKLDRRSKREIAQNILEEIIGHL